MQQIKPFNFDDNSVRVIYGDDGDPRFVVRDIAVALKYSESSLSSLNRLVGHVPEEWKGRNRILTPGGYQDLLTLTEQGLYFFVARSDKTKALPFQKWLAGEVLPSIRKTGQYQAPDADSAPQLPDFNDPVASARAWADAKESEQLALAQAKAAKPALEFMGRYVETGNTKSLRETAKILGLPEKAFIQAMIDDKILYRQSGNLLPHQKHHVAERFEVKTGERNGHAYTQTRVTSAGIDYLARFYGHWVGEVAA